MIDTCFGTHHLLFSPSDSKLWFSQGQPYSGVVGWLDVKKFEETGDAMKSQGWTPIVANVSGTGKREPFVAADKPIEPGKDKCGESGVLRHHAERQGRRDLGPDHGSGLLTHRPAEHTWCG